ncbi:hypothetical protein ACFCYN_23300 [Gottfriedia sp. NPDC056225]|uniref:hypothetical protein n=1 Tax=Gottfriedia sp. NPDC056225 TaxID=3345751 RepID=UPI0015598FC2|nr:hypothetical protein HPK19_04090 [Arthrobacter citreus]
MKKINGSNIFLCLGVFALVISILTFLTDHIGWSIYFFILLITDIVLFLNLKRKGR